VLILAATPIGNLSDASKRLEKTLIEASFIAAEDTRELKRLCRGLGITLNAKLFSLHEHNERDRIVELVELAKDETVVLVSDAGMPTISDPGFLLVRRSRFRAYPLTGLVSKAFCLENPASEFEFLSH
jgi:16S rRNA (cytidine1402-2'-O)-methyltransferase